MIIPRINGFPTIILWAVAAVVVVWFIWNKTTALEEPVRRGRQP